jgi:uncharacterized protein
MTNDDKTFLLEWMDILASGPADAWHGRVAEDVVLRLPFAPPGVASEVRGLDQAIALMSDHWRSIDRFEWHDVMTYRTEQEGLFLTTARSQVKFSSGLDYSNEYVVLTKLKDGKVVEHSEYFNPLPVVAMFAPE